MPSEDVERVTRVVLPRWVLERAREDFVETANRTGCKVDQKAADMLARVLGIIDDYGLAITGSRAAIAPADTELEALHSFYGKVIAQKDEAHRRELQRLRVDTLEDRL